MLSIGKVKLDLERELQSEISLKEELKLKLDQVRLTTSCSQISITLVTGITDFLCTSKQQTLHANNIYCRTTLSNVQKMHNNVQITSTMYSDIVQYKTRFLTGLEKLWQSYDTITFVCSENPTKSQNGEAPRSVQRPRAKYPSVQTSCLVNKNIILFEKRSQFLRL